MKNKSRNEKTHDRKSVRRPEKNSKPAARKKTPASKDQLVVLNPRSMSSILAERIAGIF